MIEVTLKQGTIEWDDVRRGKPTASKFGLIVTSKGEPSKSAEKYMNQLAIARVSGITENSYKSKAMEGGSETEAEARSAFSMIKDLDVREIGFCFYDERKDRGCSIDGMCSDGGLLEIKCPEATMHYERLLSGKVDTSLTQQIQGQMYITGAPHCYFMSYYKNVKPLIVKVERDELFIAQLNNALEKFVTQLEQSIERIK